MIFLLQNNYFSSVIRVKFRIVFLRFYCWGKDMTVVKVRIIQNTPSKFKQFLGRFFRWHFCYSRFIFSIIRVKVGSGFYYVGPKTKKNTVLVKMRIIQNTTENLNQFFDMLSIFPSQKTYFFVWLDFEAVWVPKKRIPVEMKVRIIQNRRNQRRNIAFSFNTRRWLKR